MNKRLEKKNLIAEAAKSLFVKYGYSKTSLDDIAKEAHIGKGTIYYYFESKEDIFFTITENQIQSITQRLKIKRLERRIRNHEDYFINCILEPFNILLDFDNVIFDLIHTLKTTYTKTLDELEDRWKESVIEHTELVINRCAEEEGFKVDARELAESIIFFLYQEKEEDLIGVTEMDKLITPIIDKARVFLGYIYRGLNK